MKPLNCYNLIIACLGVVGLTGCGEVVGEEPEPSTTGGITLVEVHDIWSHPKSKDGCCVISPDGKHLYGARDTDKVVFIANRNKKSGAITDIKPFDTAIGFPSQVATTTNGRFVFIGGRAGDLTNYRRNPDTGELTKVQQINLRDVGLRANTRLSVNPAGSLLCATSSATNALLVVRVSPETGKMQLSQNFQDKDHPQGRLHLWIPKAIRVDGLEGANDLAFSHDGHHLYVAGMQDQGLSLWQVDEDSGTIAQQEIMREPPQRSIYGLRLPYSVAVSPNDEFVYVVGATDCVSAFRRDADSGKLTHLHLLPRYGDEIPTMQKGSQIEVGPDGKDLYVLTATTDSQQGIARLSCNLESGELTYQGAFINGHSNVETMTAPFHLAVSPDGRHLYHCARDHTLAVFEANRASAETK